MQSSSKSNNENVEVRLIDQSRNETIEKKGYNRALKNFEVTYGKFVKDFINMTLFKQIMSFYTLGLVVFAIVIIYFKFETTKYVMQNQTNIDYYSAVVLHLLDYERDLKTQLDIINTNDYVSLSYSALYFYMIYSRELISHNISTLVINNISNPLSSMTFSASSLTNIQNMYTGLTNYSNNELNFTLLLDLNKEIQVPGSTNYKDMDMSVLDPLIYTFTPLFYQNMLNNGVNLVNSYFMGYQYQSKCNPSTYNNVYFKYPIEFEEMSPKLSNKNILDTTLDPIGQCYINTLNISDSKKTQRNNWYYQYEQPFLANQSSSYDSRLIDLLKVGIFSEIDEFFVNYVSNKITTPTNKTYIITFALKIDKLNSYLPFLSTTKKGENSFDFLSMINYPNSANKVHMDVEGNYNDQIFLQNYNIDDNSTVVNNVPDFISNMFKYTMYPNNINSDNQSININTMMLSYTEMSRLGTKYSTNYYFNVDSIVFELIAFLNNFLLYSKYELSKIKEHNITDPYDGNLTLTNSFMTQNFHKCLMRNLTDWYSFVNSANEVSRYNCLNDYCYFNNCTSGDTYYNSKTLTHFLPNCYCLPMYCQDPFTHENKNDYSSIPFGFDNLTLPMTNFWDSPFYNSSSGVINCRLSFYQKETDYIPYNYTAAAQLSTAEFQYNTTMFFLYLNEEVTITQIILKDLDDSMQNMCLSVLSIYLLLIFVVFVIFFRLMTNNVSYLSRRFDNSKEIVKIIMKISDDYEEDTHPAKLQNEGNTVAESKAKEESDDDKSKGKAEFITNGKNLESFKSDVSEDSDEQEAEGESEEVDHLNRNDSLVKEKEDKLVNKIKKELSILGINFDQKSSDRHDGRYQDELQQLIFIIVDNLEDFKIKFSLNTNMFVAETKLNQQYNDMIDAKFFKDRILPRGRASVIEDSLDNELIQGYPDFPRGEEQDQPDLSLNLILEILSTEEVINFAEIKSNFYYREPTEPSRLDFYSIIKEQNYYEESNTTNELTNAKKLENAINYYIEEIHLKWKEAYLEGIKEHKI